MIKEYAGVLLKDSGRYRRALTGNETTENGDPLWLHLCNRNEVLKINPDGPGVECHWRWTSDLHACGVRSAYGVQLARRAFADWPIQFEDEPLSQSKPDVSFIIAHEGDQRVDHVVWTVRSILAQRDVSVECLVVDQSTETAFGNRLPPAIRHLHRPRPCSIDGWRKSWAFNQGAREAAGQILVFHDGDILCPNGYAMAIVKQIKNHGAASIQRFLFNLNERDTRKLFETEHWPGGFQPERVRQNWEGGTIAVRRDAFFDLGGYDEAFVGWGGEDNEFFDRCAAVKHLRFGFVPFVHLWHPAQSDKHVANNRNITHALDTRLAMPVEQRTAELSQRKFGNPLKPDPLVGYREASCP
jgi:hypothetical protein